MAELDSTKSSHTSLPQVRLCSMDGCNNQNLLLICLPCKQTAETRLGILLLKNIPVGPTDQSCSC